MDREFLVTFFPDQKAGKMTAEHLTLPALRDKILQTTAPKKDELPWLKLAEFGEQRSDKNCLRHDGNVLTVTGCEVDHDSGIMTFEDAIRIARDADLFALFYTSASYRPEKQKWRGLFPFSRDLAPAERKKMVTRIFNLFGPIFDKASFTLSQSYLYGSVNNPDHQAVIVEGAFIDKRSDLDKVEGQKKSNGAADNPFTAYGQQFNDYKDPVDVEARLAAMTFEGEGDNSIHKTQLSVTASLMARGVPIEEIVDRVLQRTKEVGEEHWDYEKEEKTIREMCEDAEKKGYNKHKEDESQAPNSQQPVIEPVDLWGKFEPPLLPHKILPKVIEDYAFQQGEQMGCDPAGLAMAALTVCGAAITDRIKLKMKVHANWLEETRIWTALIGDPSRKKTPILRDAVRPLVEIDHRLHGEYLDAKHAYDNLSPEEKKLKPPPTHRRLRVEDTTMEAAQEVFRDSPDGLLCLQDELSGWFGAMDKYGGGKGAAKDRSFWMQAYNGGPYSVHRISRGSLLIRNLSMNLLGGVQPEPMRAIIADAHDDGLIQRTFAIVLRPATIGKDEPGIDAVSAYDELVHKLYELKPPTNETNAFTEYATSAGVSLTFSPSAQLLRRTLEERHLELQALEGINRKLAAHIGKFDGLFGRLCLLFHCIEHPNKLPLEISLKTADRVAIFLHDFLLPHAFAFYVDLMGLADDHDHLTAMAGYILAQKKESLNARDCYRDIHQLRSKRVREDIEPLLGKLEAFGWLNRTPGRRPSDHPVFTVNLEVHKRFADRAEAEAKRRKEVREMIQETAKQRRRERKSK
jgi:Protein of unknown function (DUF3987)